MDHRAGSKKQQRLEESMRDQMEDSRGISSHAAAQKHVAKLRDSRVRQHPLNIVLHHAHAGRIDRRQRADDRHHRKRRGSTVEDRMAARNQIHTGRHHGRRMDQRRNRRRTLHGIRQPHIQRNLRRFTRGAHHQQQRNCRQPTRMQLRLCRNLREDSPEAQRAEVLDQQKHRQQKAEVAHTIDNECLLACIRSRRLLEVEADQQIRRQAHAFPAYKEQQETFRQHQHGHEEHEEV